MIDPVVMEAGDVEAVVSDEGVGVDDRIQLYLGFYDRHEGRARHIRDHLRIDAPTALENTEDRHLSWTAAPSQTFALAAKIALVDLDLALHRAFIFDACRHDLSQTMVEKRGRILVDTNQFGGSSSGSPGDEVLAQPDSLFFREL